MCPFLANSLKQNHIWHISLNRGRLERTLYPRRGLMIIGVFKIAHRYVIQLQFYKRVGARLI